MAASANAGELFAVQLGTGNFPVCSAPGTGIIGSMNGLYAVVDGMAGYWINNTGQTLYIEGGYFSPLGSYGAIFDFSGSLSIQINGQTKFVSDFVWDHYSLPVGSARLPFEIPSGSWISVPPGGLLYLTAHASSVRVRRRSRLLSWRIWRNALEHPSWKLTD